MIKGIFKPILAYTAVLAFIFLTGFVVFTYQFYNADLSDKDKILNRNNTGLTLLDSNNEPFFTFDNPKSVSYVGLDKISPMLQKAVIASEDKDFYTNPGFSPKGIIRAFLTNISRGKIVEGGSTISQGLVKNSLLTSQKSMVRKFQEIILAFEINRRYGKNDILEMYLNSIYFGEGAFGVENAALTYFGIHAVDLDLAQSALLTGLLPAPSSLSPFSGDTSKSKEKQSIVLNEMAEEGYISRGEADAAAGEKLVFVSNREKSTNFLAPHFALYVRNQLIQKFGENFVIRSGLKVKTTLNKSWQEYAENTVRREVAKLHRNNAYNGAAVVLDPKTGEILVMVGSADWDDERFGRMNMAVIPRSPGSAFKPVVYSRALEESLITPATILQDRPRVFQTNYRPHNYDFRFRGPVTVRRALANSLNVPSVEVMEQVGVPEVLATANRFGITSLGNDPSRYGLSLVLGSGEVSLLELTNVYATFADYGLKNTPISILEIRDKYDSVIENNTPAPERVIGGDVSFLISSILSDNKSRAEQFGNLLTINRTAAVKTGTSENYQNALTLGYTPSLAVGVWVGNNDNTPMDRVAGSLGAAPIWKQLMQNYLTGKTNEPFIKPAGVTEAKVCTGSIGGSSSEASGSASYTEYFLQGRLENICFRQPMVSPRQQQREGNSSSYDFFSENPPEGNFFDNTFPTDNPVPTNLPSVPPTENPGRELPPGRQGNNSGSENNRNNGNARGRN